MLLQMGQSPETRAEALTGRTQGVKLSRAQVELRRGSGRGACIRGIDGELLEEFAIRPLSFCPLWKIPLPHPGGRPLAEIEWPCGPNGLIVQSEVYSSPSPG